MALTICWTAQWSRSQAEEAEPAPISVHASALGPRTPTSTAEGSHGKDEKPAPAAVSEMPGPGVRLAAPEVSSQAQESSPGPNFHHMVPLPPEDAQGRPHSLVPVAGSERGPAPPSDAPPAFRLINASDRPEPKQVPIGISHSAHSISSPEVNHQPEALVSTAALSLEKTAPPLTLLNKPVAYEITVRNVGSVTAHDVHLVDEIPAGAQVLSAAPEPEKQEKHLLWNIGSLAAGAQRRMTVELQPKIPLDRLPPAQVVFANASAPHLSSKPAPVQPAQTAPVEPAKPTPLVLKIRHPAVTLLGQPMLCPIEITNPGKVPVKEVLLTVHLPPGLEHAQGQSIEAVIGTIGPGQTTKVSLTTKAVKEGRHDFVSVVTAPGGLESKVKSTVLVERPALGVRLPVPQKTLLDRETEARILVLNSCTLKAAKVHVVQELPAGLEFVSASQGGVFEKAAGCVRWLLPTLAPGQEQELTVLLKPRVCGDLTYHVRVQADSGGEAGSEAVLHVGGIPALGLEIRNKDSQVEVGAETIYEILVTNQGSWAGTGIQVVATLPEGLVASNAVGLSPFHSDKQRVIFEPVAKLNPGNSAHFRVRLRATKPGDRRFKVQLTSDQLHGPLTREESILVYKDR